MEKLEDAQHANEASGAKTENKIVQSPEPENPLLEIGQYTSGLMGRMESNKSY